MSRRDERRIAQDYDSCGENDRRVTIVYRFSGGKCERPPSHLGGLSA